MVYTAKMNNEDVIVKSTSYSDMVLKQDLDQATYVNYLSETISVANYYEPYAVKSDDTTKVVTVSRLVPGVNPETLYNTPFLWVTDEDVVKTLGYYLADWRKASQQFEIDLPDAAATFPRWDEVNAGWQKFFTPITIPEDHENFGVVHGDLHPGNWMIGAKHEQEMDLFTISALDFDSAYRGWYVTDIGCVLFTLNMQMYDLFNDTLPDAYHAWFYQFKEWLVDSFAERYGSPIPEDDLQQGCQWRKDFNYYLYTYSLPYVDGQVYEDCKAYIDLYDSGLMPTC